MNRKRVLIIEDQRDIARMIRSAIQVMDPSLEVLDTLSAEEAALELKECGADLLIVDVRLPGISGLQLIERWRRQNLNVPIIITTGFADSLTRQQSEQLGAKAFFAKPLPMEEFLLAVRTILSGQEYRPGEDRTSVLLAGLREKTGAGTVWLCQDSGHVALRTGDPVETEDFEFENIIQSLGGVVRRGKIVLGEPILGQPSILSLTGDKSTLVISPLSSGAFLVLFFRQMVKVDPLREQLADASVQLDEIFRFIQPKITAGKIPMPDWVSLPESSVEDLHLERAPQAVEPLEAKSFWDDAALEATGFLSPGKLTFEEAERLGLAPGEKPSDPYRKVE